MCEDACVRVIHTPNSCFAIYACRGGGRWSQIILS